ncbi:MAG TPA: 50S ribosomal protein L31 [Chloroflexota bacterium]|nr:50S ribosomal protein L31 [Chloroflexota bacterium]
MRDGIHPKYALTTIHCACGNEWEIRSTRQNMRIDVCSKCHPFYTGEQRLMDTGGQVERFRRRMQRATQSAQAAQPAATASES